MITEKKVQYIIEKTVYEVEYEGKVRLFDNVLWAQSLQDAIDSEIIGLYKALSDTDKRKVYNYVIHREGNEATLSDLLDINTLICIAEYVSKDDMMDCIKYRYVSSNTYTGLRVFFNTVEEFMHNELHCYDDVGSVSVYDLLLGEEVHGRKSPQGGSYDMTAALQRRY